jgi:hypothetical protein
LEQAYSVLALQAESTACLDDFPAPKVDDSVPAYFPAVAADIRGDDSANCLHIPADSPRQLVADDTRVAADDKGWPSLPNIRGCNKRGVLPNSIPTPPSPRDDRLAAH